MNTLTLPMAELKSALTGLGKVINLKATLPVLHQVKVERTSDGWIALTGTDLDRFVTMRLEHPAEGSPTAVLIPYDQLVQLAKTCGKDEHLIIEISPETTLIKFPLADKLGASKVTSTPVSEFPATPRIKGDAMPLTPELRRSILEAMQCASDDVTRFVLNGTFIDTSNPKANYIVGTDGRHLYSANSFVLPLKNSLIIPSHKFVGWKEFNLDGEWQLKADGMMLQISSRRWRFISRQINGTYPNWRAVIPSPNEIKTTITLDSDKIDTVIKLIQRVPCHDQAYQRIGLQWKEGQFLLLAKESSQDPWFKVPVSDVKGQGKEVTVFIDRRFFIKALQYGLNTIGLIDELSALRFHHQGKQMIVMPIRADAAHSEPPANPEPAPINSRVAPPPLPPTPTPERKPVMITPATPDTSAGNPPTMEEAIDMITQIRDKLIEPLNQLRDLSLKLKSINREQKSNSKEFNTVRSTLRSLQGLKI